MKNKRVVMTLVLLLVILLLSTGYALSTTSLQIKGSAEATASDDNFIVRFKKTGTSYDEPTNLLNATATVTSDTEATINVSGLTKAGDKATATYVVENASNGIDANIVAVPSSTDTEYFKVTTTGITTAESKIVSGNTSEITVTVELIKTPIEDKATTVTVDLTATPVAQ